VKDWRHEDGVIEHPSGRYFRVLGVRVEAQGREVHRWEQPIVEQMSAGLVGFLARRIEGVLHFLVQAKVECGNMDILEIAPTVQCITANYDVHDMPPHADGFLNPVGRTTLVDAMQSEEGGRFFHEANRNVVQLLGDSPAPDPHPSYAWLTLYQLKEYVRYNNYVNVEARSLLACLGLS
jgi:oxidase EvaA